MNYVAFSGGVDSTALALLMTNATLIFTDTQWESDLRYEHLDNFERLTGREVIRIRHPESLPDYIRRAKFFPNFHARFCTRIWKIEAMNTFIGEQVATLNIGLRADEPPELRIGNLTDKPNLSIAYPLREAGYKRIDCIHACLEWGLLPRTVPWEARGGCLGCYFKRKSEVAAMHYLAPKVLDGLQTLEEEVQDGREEYFFMFPHLGMSIRQYRADLDAQPMMFSTEDVYAVAADKSGMETCGLFCNR